MKNYSILGCEKLRSVDFSQSRLERRFHGLGNCPADWSQTGVRLTDVGICLDIAVFCHLGFDVSHLDVNQFVSEGAAIAVDYFLGDFIEVDEQSRSEMSKNPEMERLSWFEVHRNGLHLAQLSHDSETEKKLAAWIEPWLPYDESSYLVSTYDNTYHKLLADYIVTGTIVSPDMQEEIESCRKQRPKLLTACLSAICDHDSESFSAHLKKFLAYYLKSEFGKSGIPTYFSIEASILSQVAKRVGIEPTGLNEKQTALIMTRKTLGLDD